MQQWTVKKLLEWSDGYFKNKGVQNPKLSSEILLAETLGCNRIDLYLSYSKIVIPSELARYKEYVLKRASHCPVQYILGKAHFRDICLYVDERVLVPRPETEILVDKALEKAESLLDQKQTMNILEVGTGSGAIAISLARELKGDFRIVATDSRRDALEVARKNIFDILGDRAAKVELFLADIIPEENILEERYPEGFGLLVSNPPYIPSERFGDLPEEVRLYEPRDALVGGKDGLDVYDKIFRSIRSSAPEKMPHHIMLEVDPLNYSKVHDLAKEVFGSIKYKVIDDYSQKERVLDIELDS